MNLYVKRRSGCIISFNEHNTPDTFLLTFTTCLDPLLSDIILILLEYIYIYLSLVFAKRIEPFKE